ncbi:MAG: hypothetical protein WB439_12170, partial [Acidobacteriaceae bacterium]
MATLRWAIACERAIIEEQTGVISLVAILETINLPPPPPGFLEQQQRPVVPYRFYLVHQWARSDPAIGERVPGRVLLIAPDGQQYGSAEFVVDLTATPRARMIGQTIGFPLFGEGSYKCVIETKLRNKWRKVGETEFGVAFI